MEEMSKTARAYYTKLSQKQKQSTSEVFKGIDKDGDGKISLEEYEKYFTKISKFKSISSSKFFKKLDKDGNGMLDFNEFITLDYLLKSERVYWCDGCSDFLDGAYFTCVECFNGAGNSYDLCCDCYGNRIHHHHTVFLDNYTLLHTMRDKIKKKREPAFNTMKTSSSFGGMTSSFGGGSTFL
ncbi:hypothetical protein M5689_016284 [Euphorbia peplus]|nr:hypothetical protein M5689_016284 [Euphorbia peplus]